MAPKSLFLYFSLLLLTSSCRQLVNPSGSVWFFTHSTGNKEVSENPLNPSNFLALEKDGSYTSDFGEFNYGTWVYSEHQIFLTGQHSKKSIIPVNYLTAREMQTGPPKGPFDNFERQPGQIDASAENPFSAENNKWRIKAASKETGKQINDRLLNHCRFWELYFTWAFDNTIQYIDVRSTPTPIKIYGNGFGLIPFNELPATWKNYFYDAADCQAANDKIKQVFDRNTIAWPHTENKYKMFISAFQQLRQQLK